jgi:hypothetical protein
VFQILATSPNPALKIKDTGTVGLPLSSRDAAAIKEASHPAPFGKGSETIIDGTRITLLMCLIACLLAKTGL